MTSPQSDAAPVRGLLLIGVAVVIGLLFLSKGFDADGSVSFSGDEFADATDADAPDAGSGEGTSASTIPAVDSGSERDPAEVPVYVANGSGTGGAAGRATETLRAAGYNIAAEPTGAAPTVTSTIVYFFDPTWQADAAAVARTLGVQPTQVEQLPTPPPFEVLGNATVAVHLGPDAPDAAPA